MTNSELIEADLQRYAATAGPEPVMDSLKPDIEGQYRRWSAWWLAWLATPMTFPDNS